jgi:hypothetical protein
MTRKNLRWYMTVGVMAHSQPDTGQTERAPAEELERHRSSRILSKKTQSTDAPKNVSTKTPLTTRKITAARLDQERMEMEMWIACNGSEVVQSDKVVSDAMKLYWAESKELFVKEAKM